jgi:hypothetical protein
MPIGSRDSAAGYSGMDVGRAQADMRHAYLGGSSGLLASGIVWLAAAAVSWCASPRAAIATLFFGGMFIFPASILFSKLAGRPGSTATGNPLAGLAVATTFWMLLAIPAAYLLSLQKSEWFFIAMLLTIGGRYLTFPTLYGLRVYWVCGGLLAAAGCAAVLLGANTTTAALAGAVIELAFAGIVFARTRRESATAIS